MKSSDGHGELFYGSQYERSVPKPGREESLLDLGPKRELIDKPGRLRNIQSFLAHRERVEEAERTAFALELAAQDAEAKARAARQVANEARALVDGLKTVNHIDDLFGSKYPIAGDPQTLDIKLPGVTAEPLQNPAILGKPDSDQRYNPDIASDRFSR